MSDPIPPVNPSDSSEPSEAEAAAEAERRAPPAPLAPPTGQYGPYGPRGSQRLAGPYPPAPYQPYPAYQPYQPYPPSGPGPSGAGIRGGRERQHVSPTVVVIGSALVLLAVLMVAALVFAGALQGMAWAAEPAQATTSRSFSVSGTPTLSLDLSAVNVQIVPGADGQVSATLTAKVQAITHAAAQQALAATTLNATQSGDTIQVNVGQPDLDGFPAVTTRQVQLTLTVPSSANLDLTLSAANLRANGISGTLVGRISAGNLILDDITVSGVSSLHVSAGNVEYHGALAPGASLNVDATAGNVYLWLPQTTPTHVQASATGGNVSVSGWSSGSARHSDNGSFSVDLNPQPTSTLSVQVTGGNVTIEPGA